MSISTTDIIILNIKLRLHLSACCISRICILRKSYNNHNIYHILNLFNLILTNPSYLYLSYLICLISIQFQFEIILFTVASYVHNTTGPGIKLDNACFICCQSMSTFKMSFQVFRRADKNGRSTQDGVFVP